MTRIGRFKDDAAERSYGRAYAAVADLWPLPATDTDVPTSFGTVRVRSSGAGAMPPFLLLHGFGGAGITWYDCVGTLAAARVVHAPDMIGGAGRSMQTAPVRSEADLARVVVEILDGLGVDRAHLVGESQGAWHATVTALHAPERVASLSLVEPNGVFARTPVRALLRMLRLGARPSDDAWARMSDWLTPGVQLAPEVLTLAQAAQGYRTALGWARTLSDAEVRSLDAPLLAIYGERSVLSSPATATRRLAELAPRAEVEVCTGRGHGVLGEIRDEVLARIVDFTGRQDAASRRPTRH